MILFLIRGLPGTGKSTYAKSLGCFHVEADMFHCADGAYNYNTSRAKLAHNWCQKAVLSAMEQGIDVAVSCTFTQKKEIDPYLDFAARTGHVVKIVRMTHDYGTVHNVPIETIEKMRGRFEDIDGEEIKE